MDLLPGRVFLVCAGAEPRVHLRGKGNQWRVCPVWTQTAALLEQLLEQRSINDQPKAAVFASNRGEALTRYGIFKVVRRHPEHLKLQRSDVKRRRVLFKDSVARPLLEILTPQQPEVGSRWLGIIPGGNQYAPETGVFRHARTC
jgi:hypothetical protein